MGKEKEPKKAVAKKAAKKTNSSEAPLTKEEKYAGFVDLDRTGILYDIIGRR